MSKKIQKEHEKRDLLIISLRLNFTRETGGFFLDDVSVYADWLEKQLIKDLKLVGYDTKKTR